LPGADSYLFTSFRDNGEKGVYFAISHDGYRWKYVNNSQPLIAPQHPGMLMRDPQIVRGPDGIWHLIWTTGWNRPAAGAFPTIGHASSRDLVHWSAQQVIDVPLEGARNAWAPEMVWDATAKHWILFWSSTIPGRYPATDASGDDGYNHRVYSMTTSDFKTFSKPALFFDPGFNCIDATLAKEGSRWILVFKDERKNPLEKKLRLAFAGSPAGPFKEITEPFTGDWVEGPSAVKVGEEWLIYFDHYADPPYYGAYRTRDWKSFEDVTRKVDIPGGVRHGTVVRVSEAEAAALEALH
jgi:hypothetical protein